MVNQSKQNVSITLIIERFIYSYWIIIEIPDGHTTHIHTYLDLAF